MIWRGMSLVTLAFIATVSAATASGATTTTTYTIDASTLGPRLDGFGAISGGGATSRLLFTYSQPVVSQILDLLFLPQYGASLHHLKVEVGGDGQSSEGVEPSHMHSLEAPPNFDRGYEVRLMKEARSRNPGILLSALAWTWPGWVGSGSSSPWTNTSASILYLLTWLQGLRDHHNLTLNYLNADWNERGWSPGFVIDLRAALDGHGFAYLGLVCGDDAHAFSCAAEAAKNATLRASIVALGSHGPQPPSPPLLPNLPLWNTEVHVTDPAGSDLAGIFARAYLAQNISSGTLWNALSAYNPGLFSPDWGIFRAWWPWCDYYEPVGKLWVFAHWTQATQPGMHWLNQGAGGGSLVGGGVYVSFLHPTTHQFTLIVYKPSANTTVEEVSFTLLSPALANVTALYPVKSTIGVGGSSSSPAPDLGAYFIIQPTLPVDPTTHTTPPLSIPPGTLWTFTSLPGQFTKGAPPRAVLTPSPFPATAYRDDFDACPPSQEAPYFTDMTGVFECTQDASGGGRGGVMAQSVPMHPIAWRPEEQRPFSLFAANISQVRVNTSIDFAFSAPGEGVLLGVRANPNCCGRVITGEDLMPGAWLWVGSSGDYALFNAIANVTATAGGPGVIVKGKATPAPIPALQWHTLGLVVLPSAPPGGGPDTLTATFDGTVLFQGVSLDEASTGVPTTGFVGIGTQAWGQYVQFDRFFYQPL